MRCSLRSASVFLCILLSGCAASLQFIDRSSGDIYLGKTGGTSSGSGNLSAVIEGDQYTGTWIYSPSGGGYSISSGTATAVGNGGMATATGTGTTFTSSARGNGMIHMKSASGQAMRCVFEFNSMSDTGMGECQRGDGKLFDVTIKR